MVNIVVTHKIISVQNENEYFNQQLLKTLKGKWTNCVDFGCSIQLEDGTFYYLWSAGGISPINNPSYLSDWKSFEEKVEYVRNHASNGVYLLHVHTMTPGQMNLYENVIAEYRYF